MNNTARYIILCFLLVSFDFLHAQEEKEKNWTLDGYISNLSSFDLSSDSLRFDEQLHNRLRFRWFPSYNFNFRLELRNRLLIGDTPAAIPQLGKFLDSGNDYFDLSYSLPEDKKWVFHSIVDRASIEYSIKTWEIKLGRQRVNWGINLVWNPNDLFNNFSFLDFDYPERPGSDALLIKKYLGNTSSIELISNIFDDFDESIFGSRFLVNKGQYDLQLILAKAKEDITLGFGWAGNIKQAGFKGELSYFQATNENRSNAFAGSIGVDYIFKSSLYLNFSVLYSSDLAPDFNILGFSFANTGSVSARTLSPFHWSCFTQTSYTFTPLLRGGLAIMYFPGERNALFINPSFDYSLDDNFDLSIVFQLYYDKFFSDYQNLAKVSYLRLKYSF